MRSHPAWRETRLVSKSNHTHGAASASASGDQRISCQVHFEETVLKAEQRHAVDAGRALLFAFLRHWPATTDTERCNRAGPIKSPPVLTRAGKR